MKGNIDMNLLLVIDLQKEFINEFTKKSISEISNLINSKKFNKILFTKFVNNKGNPTFKKLNWEGCMDEESSKICLDVKDNYVMNKETYTAYNEELIGYIKNNDIKNIYLCGIDIDCCVLVTALNLFENNYNVYILKDYCYSMSGEERKKLVIDILKHNIGDKYII